jgi:glycosyl transferase family 2
MGIRTRIATWRTLGKTISARARRTVRVHVAGRDRVAATELCIRSLREYAGRPFTLTVGDGGSTDGSIEMLQAMEDRGWLELEVDSSGPWHAQWLDRWLGRCDADFAVFADNDVEFLGEGWLRDLVNTAVLTGAALVYGEMCPDLPQYVEHHNDGRVVRMVARPAPWLMLVHVPQVARLGLTFAYHEEKAADRPLVCDIGATFYRGLQARGLRCVEMPAAFRAKYRHYGAMSWPLMARRLSVDPGPLAGWERKTELIERRLELARERALP